MFVPAGPRWVPSACMPNQLPRTVAPEAPSMSSPTPLKEMTLRSATALPPIVAESEPGSRKIPALALPPLTPFSPIPIQLPAAVNPVLAPNTPIPIEPAVIERPSIELSSASTASTGSPDRPWMPAQGPPSMPAVVQEPPSIDSGERIVGSVVPGWIVSISSPLNSFASKAMESAAATLKFDSSIAARSVHVSTVVLHSPSPGSTSAWSPMLSTV